MKRKTLKILFPRKESYCKLFKLLKKNVKNISKRRKLNIPWKIKVYYHVYIIKNKELAPVLYATIDQDKKGKLLASLYENKGKTNKIITNCKHLMDSRWKVKAVLKVTGLTLTEKYTSLKILGLFRAYNSQYVVTHILGQETLSDSEDSEDPEDDEDVESLN